MRAPRAVGLGLAVAASAAVFAACLSSAPPAPAVRFFDPTPAAVAGAAGPATVRVTAAPHLAQPFAVRVGPRELAFDPVHSWIAEPRDLVRNALGRALPPVPPDAAGPQLEIHVDAFELDVQAAPRARVRLEVRRDGSAVQPVEAEVEARSREPDALAAAMADALGKAIAGVVARR